MCGIVSYLGGAGNGLTRILSGMSAIIYRAPDSTGIGVLGDDESPFRTLKALGGLPALVEAMAGREICPNRPAEWLRLFMPELSSPEGLAGIQHRLLQFEGFPAESIDSHFHGGGRCVSMDDLLSVVPGAPATSIKPGRPGSPHTEISYRIGDRSGLISLLKNLIDEYDLSPVVCKTLIGCALRKEGEVAAASGDGPAIALSTILERFEDLFEDIYWSEILGAEEAPGRCGALGLPTRSEEALWRLLARTSVSIPVDLDRDGVRRLLRDLEVAVMCRLRENPLIHEELEEHLRTLWPSAAVSGEISWRDVFFAEKAANVYGWAAAAAWIYIREKEAPPRFGSGTDVGGLSPGETDPHTLRYLKTPVIAHGRWALQAPITVENAHPFTDRLQERGVVLNGQFSGVTEADLLKYLENSGSRPRSGNSAEYLPLLWELYYNSLLQEKRRFEVIRRQVDAGLENLYLGSQAIDFRICRQVEHKSTIELDEMAFVEACRRIVSEEGQLAAAAVSARSPRRLYVAAHHRPVFIVQRKDNGDVMVVSDIYAALGLFPQSLILARSRELLEIEKERRRALQSIRSRERPASRKASEIENEFNRKRAAILAPFAVQVFPLEGTSLLACIETVPQRDGVQREIRITDFSGTFQPDLEALEVVLNPLQTRRQLLKSFYEAHLEEIPERLRDALGAYLPEMDGTPSLPLHERYLRRRFGPHLERLKRVLLVGMGSSYRTALMSRPFFQAVTPGLKCDVLRPVELEHVGRQIDTDRDLVVLLSGSGTSADMVELANDIGERHGALIGITEKPFSDMALIAGRSGGVIPILSGEEVTYSALKSSVCTALVCRLLAVWLASKSGGKTWGEAVCEDLLRIPALFEEMIEDDTVRVFCRRVAEESGRSHAVVVFDAVHTTAVGLEAAEKLQEASWTAVGKALDYRDLMLAPLEKDLNSNLVIVNATNAERLSEALSVMKVLYIGGIPFAAVTFDHSRLDEARFYSRGLCIDLPKVHDADQPMLDLAFYYSLAREFGMAHGRRDPGFPRNRAKSVTVARHRPAHEPSVRRELKALQPYAAGPRRAAVPDIKAPTVWEGKAGDGHEADYYGSMRRLARVLRGDQALRDLLPGFSTDHAGILEALGDSLLEDGEIVLVAMDRGSLAVARDVAATWRRFSKSTFEIADPGASIEPYSEDGCMVFLGTSSPEALGFAPVWRATRAHPRRLCVSCAPSPVLGAHFQPPASSLELDPSWKAVRPEALYAAINLLLIEALKTRKPQDAASIGHAFRFAPRVIETVLNDGRLWDEIAHAAAENRSYRTAAFVGSCDGTGDRWAMHSEEAGACLTGAYIYGESAHGPVVTVDPSPEKKFVPITGGKELRERFGPEKVEEWESRYLMGRTIDQFLASPGFITRVDAGKPFFANKKWYLPVLSPDYDAVRDNLIFLDATRERYLPQAMDELSLYGCRFARVVLICQEAFKSLPALSELYHYPVSQSLVLPALAVGDGSKAIPEILLPFAMSLTSMAVSARGARHPGDARRLGDLDRVFQDAFGAFGQTLQQTGITLLNLGHRVIEALGDLAPVVREVTGTAVYRVRRIDSADQLDELVSGSKVFGAEQVHRSFAASLETDTPYYLVYPERRKFLGEAEAMARETLSDDYWRQWFEVYGDTWRCLSRRRIESNEGPGERPRIEMPILDAEGGLSGLLHLYVLYREWDHDADLAAQIETTATALGKHRSADDPEGIQYTKLVSHFNNFVIPEGYLWTDAFLSLASRSFVFRKPAKDAALHIAERLISLAGSAAGQGLVCTTEQLASALHAVWPGLPDGPGDEEAHWRDLEKAVTRYLAVSRTCGG